MTHTHPLEATLHSRGERWVLTMTREFPHPAETVWQWLTDPERLRRWSPVVPDHRLDAAGPTQIRENPGDEPVDGEVLVVDPPRELLHRWGSDVLHWQLTPTDSGCRLRLEHDMADNAHAAENAAGWHICLGVLADNLDGHDVPRLVGDVVMQHGFGQLRDGYTEALALG